MPKIEKCLKCLKLRYSADFKLETQDRQLFNFHEFWFPYAQHRSLLKKTERSDSTILGTLVVPVKVKLFFKKFAGLLYRKFR